MKVKIRELLEKITVKNHITKIRFSHVMCICGGALIPIYSDVLFLHGFDSSTVSAIMDSIVAISVIYAAYSVRNWTKDKIKDKGFQHAEIILTKLHQSSLMTISLANTWEFFCSTYYITSFLNTSQFESFEKDKITALGESKELDVKLNELIIDLHGLKSWDMKCDVEDEYLNYITECTKLRRTVDEYFLREFDNGRDNSAAYYLITKKDVENKFAVIIEMYKMLEIRYEKAFSKKSANE